METQPLIVERTYNAPISKVWKAITDKNQMKEWYFELEEFRAEKGFKFQFFGGDEKEQYLHVCEVLIVEPPHKLSYSWTYPGHNTGYSVVTWELFEEGERKTRLKLTHEGLDSFPKDKPNFAVTSFTEGWNSILGDSLKKYVEEETIRLSVTISSTAEVIWDILLNPGNQWGKAFGGGTFVDSDWKVGSEVVWKDMTGDVGARGVVKEHRPMEYLQVDMYDDVTPTPGSETGPYAEKYKLTGTTDGTYTFSIESGPLSGKYIPDHTRMWEEGLKLIKEISESRSNQGM
jgi:uncharacterized protein YndB with AHSA1/START domain